MIARRGCVFSTNHQLLYDVHLFFVT